MILEVGGSYSKLKTWITNCANHHGRCCLPPIAKIPNKAQHAYRTQNRNTECKNRKKDEHRPALGRIVPSQDHHPAKPGEPTQGHVPCESLPPPQLKPSLTNQKRTSDCLTHRDEQNQQKPREWFLPEVVPPIRKDQLPPILDSEHECLLPIK